MISPPPSSALTRMRSFAFHALRMVLRGLPIGTPRRDGLREWFFARFPRIRPSLPQGRPAATVERRPRVHSAGRAIGYVAHRYEPLPDPLPATLVAFYLPQFHTIPENDAWWGKGFTEWRNVARALPQFEGHIQPRLPADLGFYDMRNPQVLRDQAELAQAYGIGAFCMYFYWFGGRTLLELVHQQWLNDQSITLPICLCWANENWSRIWDGREEDVLISQEHSAQDDIAFISHVAPYMRDLRYLRVDGKPLLLIYRPGKLPDPRATAERWREWCRVNGIGEICLAYVQSFERPDPRNIGFDAAVEFPPNLSTATNLTARQKLFNPCYQGEVLDWRAVAREFTMRAMPEYSLFPGVNCGWDNEPRRPGRGRTYVHASPRRYGEWLRRTIFERSAGVAPGRRIVFVNAWNEWAEGAMLEPDARNGHSLLSATRDALGWKGKAEATANALPCAVIHAWYPDILDSMLTYLEQDGRRWRLIVTTAPEREAEVRRVLTRHPSAWEVHVLENRGRDILPFLRVVKMLSDQGEDIILKLHTKRSPHRADGNRWRVELLQALGSTARVETIRRAFDRDSKLGLVAPEGHVQPLTFYWGANATTVLGLIERAGLSVANLENMDFVSGSMYWIRMSALEAVLDLDLGVDDFEAEGGQVDGTLAHALERMVSLLVAANGFRFTTAAAVCGETSGESAANGPAHVDNYRYARRD